MDFFDHQDRARRNTAVLVAYLLAAVALTILAVYLVVVLAVRPPDPRDPRLLGGVAGGTLLVIWAGMLYKLIELGSGGQAIALGLGGDLVPAGTRDPRERRLLNVVEEMALASGVPAPTVYRLAREGGINAFAAGRTPRDAVVGVTDGALRLLTRDELQGVIAHEFSHVLNGDMGLNLRLIALLHGILLLGLAGRAILRGAGRSRGNRKGGGGVAILGLGLLIVGYVGVFFAHLIKAAISRQREFLADASAVQFTRNPQGIGGALRKIGGYAQGSRLDSARAEEVSHMLFGEGLGQVFATHPPIVERIRRLDPSFGGQIAEVPEGVGDTDEAVALEVGFAASSQAGGEAAGEGAEERIAVEPARVAARVGTLTPERLRLGRAVLASIPPAVRQALQDPLGAQAVVLGLLLQDDEEVRRRQWEALDHAVGPAVRGETLRLQGVVKGLGRARRLPVLDLAVPALRLLSPAQRRAFSSAVDALVRADERVSPFEFTLKKLLDRHVGGAGKGRRGGHGAAPRGADLALVLSILARHGQHGEVERAFQAGAARVAGKGSPLSLVPREGCTLRALDGALGRLDLVSPTAKRRVIDAAAHCALADGSVGHAEVELLRAVSDAIDCPMPPFLESWVHENAERPA